MNPVFQFVHLQPNSYFCGKKIPQMECSHRERGKTDEKSCDLCEDTTIITSKTTICA